MAFCCTTDTQMICQFEQLLDKGKTYAKYGELSKTVEIA